MDVGAFIIAVFRAVQDRSEGHQPPRHRATKPKPPASGILTIGIAADFSGLDTTGASAASDGPTEGGSWPSKGYSYYLRCETGEAGERSPALDESE